MSIVVEEFAKEAARRSIRRRASEEAARVRRTFPEAMAYGAGGASAFLGLQHVRELIEHKGAIPPSRKHFRIGKRLIPTKVPAAAATGFLAAGLIPYAQDFIRARRAQKKLTSVQVRRVSPRQKLSAMISPVVFKAPHMRGRMRARVAERSKNFASKRFRMAHTTGIIMPGEHRA